MCCWRDVASKEWVPVVFSSSFPIPPDKCRSVMCILSAGRVRMSRCIPSARKRRHLISVRRFRFDAHTHLLTHTSSSPLWPLSPSRHSTGRTVTTYMGSGTVRVSRGERAPAAQYARPPKLWEGAINGHASPGIRLGVALQRISPAWPVRLARCLNHHVSGSTRVHSELPDTLSPPPMVIASSPRPRRDSPQPPCSQ